MRTLARRLCGAGLCRACWAGLGILHALPWLGATRSLIEQPSVAGFVGWLGLALTITCFALKTLDVSWLRLGSRRQMAIVFLACALVHHEAAVDGIDEVGAVAVIVTVTVSGALRVFPALRSSLATRPSIALPRWRLCLRRAVVLKPLDPMAVQRASRAPPLAA